MRIITLEEVETCLDHIDGRGCHEVCMAGDMVRVGVSTYNPMES
jgi:hypothetical protein